MPGHDGRCESSWINTHVDVAWEPGRQIGPPVPDKQPDIIDFSASGSQLRIPSASVGKQPPTGQPSTRSKSMLAIHSSLRGRRGKRSFSRALSRNRGLA